LVLQGIMVNKDCLLTKNNAIMLLNTKRTILMKNLD